MFFVLSKIFGFLTVPSNLVVITGLLGVALMRTRFSRAGGRLLIAAVILIAVIGVLPIGSALALLLEDRFPQWDFGKVPPSGVVILGGTIDAKKSGARGQISLGEAAERITSTVEIARKYPTARVVISGGTESEFVGRLLESLGVQRDRITLESQSRNTAENAAFTKGIIDPKPGERWLLITSAMHMPRAIGSFRNVGFPIEAYPVDYQTAGPQDLWSLSDPLEGIRRTNAAVHEWVGLLIYWMTGRISAPFPKSTPAGTREKR